MDQKFTDELNKASEDVDCETLDHEVVNDALDFKTIVAQEIERFQNLVAKFEDLRDDGQGWTRELGLEASIIGTLQLLIAHQYQRRNDLVESQRCRRRAIICYEFARRKAEAKRIQRGVGARPNSVTETADWWQTPITIMKNPLLREPQKQAFLAAYKHFKASDKEAILQLPVGCGKSGLMALLCYLPIQRRQGRVLVVTPNVEIRKSLRAQFDSDSEQCFYSRFKVLEGRGPCVAELSRDANILDCDEADVIIANIQQLLAPGMNDWLGQMAPDYFDWIFIDEGHHNPAASWRKCLEHFETARVISLTATPFRSDNKGLEGELIYKYELSSAIRAGYVKPLYCWTLDPSEVKFVYNGEDQHSKLNDILELRDHDWFSRGIALAPECNQHIVDASLQALIQLRKMDGFNHKIIAAACSIDHGRQICALYRERGYRAVLLHSYLKPAKQDKIRASIREHRVDVVVQVQMLGEGADYPSFSVAAIFRPFRHFTTYYQFIGRILRRVTAPDKKLANRGIIISHRGLNLDRWWDQLLEFDSNREQPENPELQFDDDEADPEQSGQATFDFDTADSEEIQQHLDLSERRYLGSMEVVSETVTTLQQIELTPISTEESLKQLESTLAFQGLSLGDLGLSRNEVEAQLQRKEQVKYQAEPRRVNRQRKRQQQRRRLNERVRSAGRILVDYLGLPARGYQMQRELAGSRRSNNLGMAIILLNREVKRFLGVESKQRGHLPLEDLQRAYESMDGIVESVKRQLGDRFKQRRRTQDSLRCYPLFRKP